MLGANLVRMILLALVPVLYWTDALSMASLLAIACAVGVASVLFDVSWMSYVPTLVRDPKHYVEAGAKMGMSSSAADVAGPGLADGLVYLVAQSALLTGPTLIVLATGPRPVMVGTLVLSFFTTYLGLGVAGVVIVSLRQASTPQSMMGRMTAVFRTLLFGGGALGGLSAGLLCGRIGAEGALTVAAIGSATVLIALALSPVTRLHGLPSPPEEPVTAAVDGQTAT